MPRKREIDLADKLKIPQSGRVNIDSLRIPALPLKHFPKHQQWGFKPTWENIDTTSLREFAKALLDSPIFKENTSGGIYLHDPQSPRAISCQNVNILFLGLSGELAEFFMAQKGRRWEVSNQLKRHLFLLSGLHDLKRELVSLGIVREKVFDDTIKKLIRWQVRAFKMVTNKLPAAQKDELEGLAGKLKPYFEEYSNLNRARIYIFIAYLLQYLLIEEGEVKKIAERIGKRLQRSKGLGKLDIKRLEKTIDRLLPHMSNHPS